MKSDTRRQYILQVLTRSEAGLVTIPELSKALGVSEMTIRRDLDYLESQEQLRRIFGGAIALKDVTVEEPYNARARQSNNQKITIGRLAAGLVQDGQSLIFDSGTTTRQVAENLADKKDLTVITNNILIAEGLGQIPQVKTILLGGQVKPRELCTIGTTVRQALEAFTVDIAFLGTAGFSLHSGITDIDIAEVEIKQAMIKAARQVYLVADSKKYNSAALVRVAPLNAAHKIITDDHLPAEAVQAILAEGIQVITPGRLDASNSQS